MVRNLLDEFDRFTMPELDHERGYYYSTLENIFDSEELEAFDEWIQGQTVAKCSETGEFVFYKNDVERFIELMNHKQSVYF